jgi:ABC-type Fe3+/spermidine/putrescine transport system ATPase subunit
VIADRIALMSNGRVEQVSTPQEFFFNPHNERVSEFVGMPNIIECFQSRILASGLVEVVSDEMKMILPFAGNNIKKIAIPPEDIYISDVSPPGPAVNRFTGTVEKITVLDSIVRVGVSIGRKSILAELPVTAFDELAIEEGKEVHVVIKMRRLRYVET